MSAFEVHIRECVLPSDEDAVQRIVVEAGVFSAEETALAVELVQQRMTSGVASGYDFVFAERDDQVIGYTCFGPIPATRGSFDLYWIAVHNDHRRQGVGAQLLARTEGRIHQRGGERVYVETSSQPSYAAARRFYHSYGYHVQARLRDYYARGDDKLVYVKLIE